MGTRADHALVLQMPTGLLMSSLMDGARLKIEAVASAKSLKEMIRWKDRDIEPDHFWDEEASPSLADLQSIEFRSVVFNYPLQPEKVVLSKWPGWIEAGWLWLDPSFRRSSQGFQSPGPLCHLRIHRDPPSPPRLSFFISKGQKVAFVGAVCGVSNRDDMGRGLELFTHLRIVPRQQLCQ